MSRTTAATILLLIVAVGLALRIGVDQLSTRRFIRVDDGRMEPAVKVGSLAILELVSVRDIALGDVLQYAHPSQPARPVLLRVREELAPRGSLGTGRLIRMRGDAPDQTVSWDAELHGTAWRLSLAVPAAGWLVTIDRSALFLAPGVVALLLCGVPLLTRPRRRAA